MVNVLHSANRDHHKLAHGATDRRQSIMSAVSAFLIQAAEVCVRAGILACARKLSGSGPRLCCGVCDDTRPVVRSWTKRPDHASCRWFFPAQGAPDSGVEGAIPARRWPPVSAGAGLALLAGLRSEAHSPGCRGAETAPRS